MKIIDGKYTLRPFTSSDEKGVLDLWKIAFNSTMSPEFFRWKYLENPYKQAMMLCVSDAGQVVTFYGGIPYLFQYSEDAVPVVHLMDIMSHPMHRQNRIFEKTAKQFMSYFCNPENLLLMYGFPGEFHYSIGERILNYRKINQPLYLTFSLNYVGGTNESPLHLNELSSDIQLRVERLESMESLNNDAIWFDRLWEKCKKDYAFSIIRDSKFVNWRFLNHPEKQYIILKFVNSSNNSSDISALYDPNRDTTQEAFVVLHIKGTKATIVDMLMANSLQIFRKIISLIIEYLATMSIKYIETWFPENHFLATHALNCGFQSQKEPIGIITTVSLFEHSPSLEWVKSNLYYNMGDGDLL